MGEKQKNVKENLAIRTENLEMRTKFGRLCIFVGITCSG